MLPNAFSDCALQFGIRFAHSAPVKLSELPRSPELPKGPTKKMNLFSAINNALGIALETDPK